MTDMDVAETISLLKSQENKFALSCNSSDQEKDMNQKITMVVIVVSLIIGIGGFFYGLSQSFPEPEKTNVPVDAQATASSDVSADDTTADMVRYDQLLQQVAPLSGTTIT